MKRGYWWPDHYEPTPGLAVKCVAEWSEISGADSDGTFAYPFWVLEYAHSPFGEICIDGIWMPRFPGSVLLASPNTPYQRRQAKSIQSHVAYIGFFHGEDVDLTRLTGEQGIILLHDPAGLTGSCLARGADLGGKMGEHAYWRVLGVLCEIIGLLRATTRHEHDMPLIAGWDTDAARERPLPERLRSFLSRHLDRRVSLQEMATAMGVSVSWLSHAYPEMVGETPQATHLSMRLERAREMLFCGNSIKSLARQFGFADVPHFSKSFQEKFGQPPAAYRASVSPR